MAFRRDSPGISALSGQMAFSAVKWVFKRKIDRGPIDYSSSPNIFICRDAQKTNNAIFLPSR